MFGGPALNIYWFVMLTSYSGNNHVLSKHGDLGQYHPYVKSSEMISCYGFPASLINQQSIPIESSCSALPPIMVRDCFFSKVVVIFNTVWALQSFQIHVPPLGMSLHSTPLIRDVWLTTHTHSSRNDYGMNEHDDESQYHPYATPSKIMPCYTYPASCGFIWSSPCWCL